MPEAPLAYPGHTAHPPRSIALIGPYNSGKSTLFEALLAAAGTPLPRRNTTPRHETRLAHTTLLGDAWSLLDCPGAVEFAHEAACALAGIDLAILVVEPNPERARTAAPLLWALDQAATPTILFVNKIDTLDTPLADTLAAYQALTTRKLLQRQVPLREGGRITGYVDVVSERAYRYRRGEASALVPLPAADAPLEAAARAALAEALADHDDALLEQVLEDVTPDPAALYRPLHGVEAAGTAISVLLGAAEPGAGLRRLWKALRHDTPAPDETAARLGIAAGDSPLAQILRTAHAGAAGRLSWARIWRGTLLEGQSLHGSRIGGILRYPAGEAQKSPAATAGEIVTLTRLEHAPTGSTLGDEAPALRFPAAAPPAYALAVSVDDPKDEIRLSGALHKLLEEDAALSLTQDGHDLVLHGQGELHLNAALARLANGFGVKVATAKPAIPYRETIRLAVKQNGRLKRQTGGHGQFADVKLELAPRPRGAGFAFAERVVGGSVPRRFIPAVGEGAEAAMAKGPLGHPVVDVEVTLLDGGFHAVDSSDQAFHSATRAAVLDALAKADPVLLEPVDKVRVMVPNDFTAVAQRLLSGRRGQILGFAELDGRAGWDCVEALVPAAELHDAVIELRSLTMGLGTLVRGFDHLAEVRGR